MDENAALSILYANTKRKKRTQDLITIAEACDTLIKLYGSTQAVAKAVGLGNEMIRQFHSLLKLPEPVKDLISSRQIDKIDVAYRIVSIRDEKSQIIAAKSLTDSSSSKDARDIIRLFKSGDTSIEDASRIVKEAKPKGLHVFVMDFDDRMYEKLLTSAKTSDKVPAQLVKEIVEKWLESHENK